MTTRTKHTYQPIAQGDVPEGVRFDVPRSLAGQTIEIAYGGFGRAEHGEGDEYMRRTDQSVPTTQYYRRVRDAGGGGTYRPTFAISSSLSADDAAWLSDQQGDDIDLSSIADICAQYRVRAELRDMAGFTVGWVAADGSYRLT